MEFYVESVAVYYSVVIRGDGRRVEVEELRNSPSMGDLRVFC